MGRNSSQALLILSTAFGLIGIGQAQDSKTPYAQMAPIDQYLMTESAEIALARSAAPASISGDATIVVLKQHGYETAVKGKNGFVCIVERSWMAPFDWPEFWNPKMRGPICFNPPAVRSVLPFTYQKDRDDPGWLAEDSNHGSPQTGGREKANPGIGTRRDVLHDVTGAESRRCARSLASASDVLWHTVRRRRLGSRSSRLAGVSESAVSERS